MAKQEAISPRKRIQHALWHRKDLEWKLEEHQLPVYRKIKNKAATEKQNKFVLNASRRWGKSFLLCILALEIALSIPGSIVLYAASTQKQVRESTQPTFRQILTDCPKGIKPSWRVQQGHWQFPNGSCIRVTGLDGGRVDSIRGSAAQLVIVDEAGFVDGLDYAVRSVLFPMTSTTNGQMILSSNAPLTPGHPFVKIFTREAEVNDSYVKQTIYDCKKFSKEDVARFAKEYGGEDSSDFRREFLCEFTIDESKAVVPEFTHCKSDVVQNWTKPAFFNAVTSLDLGFIDDSGALFGYYDFKRAKIIVEDELLFKKANSAEIVRECLKKEQEVYGGVKPIRYADGQAYSLNDLTTIHGYTVLFPRKDALEAQVNELRLDVKAGRLIINPRCKILIGQLEDAIWDKNRTKFARDSDDGHNDLLAALLYLVRNINRQSNPYPHGYGFDLSNSLIRTPALSPTLDAFKRLFTHKT